MLFKENFEGNSKILKNDNAGRISSIAFNLYIEVFQIINIYGPSKPYKRENFFQSLINYTANTQNTILGGDFNMVEKIRDRMGGSICNTNLVGSEALAKLIKLQNLHDTWWKANPENSQFTYHRTQPNIDSRLDKIYAT